MSTRARGGLAGLLLLIAAALAGCGPLIDAEAAQERAIVPAERPAVGQSLDQSFVARRPRLTAVEVLLAVYPAEAGEDRPADGAADDEGELLFRLRAAGGSDDLVSVAAPVAGLAHNSHYRLTFAPQPDSAGREYHLEVSATSPTPARATVWSSGDDAYPEGASSFDGQPRAGDLVFRAYYDYDLPWLLADLADALPRRGWLFVPALAALLLPGLALQRWLLPGAALDAAERLGLWLGLGLAVAPLVLLLTTVLGLRLGPAAVAGLLALAGLAAALRPPLSRPRLRSRLGRPSGGPGRWLARHATPAAGALLASAGALVLRYVHARDLALPLWGDPVHHTLIAQLIAAPGAAQGQVPADYGPLVPTQPFIYHFGYHVQVVFVHWLAGLAAELAGAGAGGGIEVVRAVLFVGQLLSGLLVFPTYLLASRLAGDRRAGLVAGVVVGLVSTLPAYSVTWSRYPQLAGLAILPAAALLAERALAGPKLRARTLVAAALAAAGIVLTHPRIALLFGAYVVAHLAVAHFPLRRAGEPLGERLRPWGRAGLLAALTAALTLPWLVRLAGSWGGRLMLQPGAAPAAGFPFGLLTAGLDRYLLAAAIASVGVSLYLRRSGGPVVALWVGLGLLAANLRALGLPISLWLDNDSLAISLFLPVAVLVGLLAVGLAELAGLAAWPRGLRALPAALLAGLGVWGAVGLAGIVNPVCILATAPDVEAIRWVAANTPPGARFLINSFAWQGTIYMGSDAGYWLGPLAGRYTSPPPIVYAMARREDVLPIRELAAATQPEPLDPTALLPRLRAAGLTHVFVGSRGGTLTAPRLLAAPGFRLIYSNGRAWVFEVSPETSP